MAQDSIPRCGPACRLVRRSAAFPANIRRHCLPLSPRTNSGNSSLFCNALRINRDSLAGGILAIGMVVISEGKRTRTRVHRVNDVSVLSEATRSLMMGGKVSDE